MISMNLLFIERGAGDVCATRNSLFLRGRRVII
jgi:hypothetical protein